MNNNKILILGDLHFGFRRDDPSFQESILTFIDWVIDLSIKEGFTHCVQLGDWFDSRNNVNVATVNYSIEGAKRLNNHFGIDNFFILMGNHDLFHLHRLDVSSLAILQPYATIVDDLASIIDDSILAAPWIVDEEMWNLVVEGSKEFKFLFAHLELNGFLVNDQYAMEHGFSHRELKGFKRVITGHYHSPQKKDNVQYVGTPYPITMNEVNEEHGVWAFEPHNNKLEFIEYHGSKAISLSLSDYLDKGLSQYDPTTTSVRIEFPDDLEDETLLESVRKELEDEGFREVKIKYRGNKANEIINQEVVNIEAVDNIDELVLSYLEKSAPVKGVSNEMLKELYQQAKDYHP
jgi:DNA repair exonuclease SbcCD nuclease subunit